MLDTFLIAVTLVSGTPQQESKYEVMCGAPKKGSETTQYECAMGSKDLSHIDPQTCRNFDIKEARVLNAKIMPRLMHANCKEYEGGQVAVTLTLDKITNTPILEQDAETEVLPPKDGFIMFKYNDAPALDETVIE